MRLRFWKKRSTYSEETRKTNKKKEDEAEKLCREYQMKVECLKNFMSIPTLTQMARACEALESKNKTIR